MKLYLGLKKIKDMIYSPSNDGCISWSKEIFGVSFYQDEKEIMFISLEEDLEVLDVYDENITYQRVMKYKEYIDKLKKIRNRKVMPRIKGTSIEMPSSINAISTKNLWDIKEKKNMKKFLAYPVRKMPGLYVGCEEQYIQLFFIQDEELEL